jgi:hypothetical protein
MAEIDAFAAQLWEEAKGFLEKARATSVVKRREAYLHAALNLGFCSLEAHLNAIAEDFLTREDLLPHERSVLLEKRVDLEHGVFRLSNVTQIYRLEDRLLFLCTRFSKRPPLDRGASYWAQFKEALELRNNLTHPKEPTNVAVLSVERALLAILDVLDISYRRIYGQKYPGKKRGLESAVEL